LCTNISQISKSNLTDIKHRDICINNDNNDIVEVSNSILACVASNLVYIVFNKYIQIKVLNT